MIIKLVAARESSDLKFLFPLAYIEKMAILNILNSETHVYIHHKRYLMKLN